MSAGVEFCMQGALKMIPQTSISGRIDMWASIFGELKGLGVSHRRTQCFCLIVVHHDMTSSPCILPSQRLSFKIAGGSVTADAVYLDGGYRLKEITAYIWRKYQMNFILVGSMKNIANSA